MSDDRDRLKAAGAALGSDPRGWTRKALQSLADGPILNPNRVALPLGRCSHQEMARRERV